MMRSILFLDRDGVILIEPADDQIDTLDKFVFYPGVLSALRTIATWDRFDLVLVTNQDGLGTDSFPESDFRPLQDLMMRTLDGEGIRFVGVHVDPTFPDDGADTRKPGIGMLKAYVEGDYDLGASWVIGDRSSDMELANNLGTGAIRIAEETDSDAAFTSTDWNEIVAFLRGHARTALIERATNETRIRVSLRFDGNGTASISTGLGFFDHMLEQIARYASWDLEVQCEGDLHIDEHHTIEDVGIALGEAIREGLGDKRGITRYASTTPMDEALAQVALDLSGRSWLEWNVRFEREKIGDVPTEMFSHFFRSMADAGRFTLHVSASGENEHHLTESIFKGVGRCFRTATRIDSDGGDVPSTKGVL